MAGTPDLFGNSPSTSGARAGSKSGSTGKAKTQTGNDGSSYTAHDIEVLEGLEPVRRRPGMYIGGTDERALHHLAAEIIDNAMDEVVAGHATRIEVSLSAGNCLTIEDNGRGIPIDPHPKFKDKSALEVILTTLHSGGKFGSKAYATSGGLHGVGLSVVNALARHLLIEVARDRIVYAQNYARGLPQDKLQEIGKAANRRGTRIQFTPDPEIFGEKAAFKPATLYKMVRSKAYLYAGVELRWRCDSELIAADSATPESESICFPGGIADYLETTIAGRTLITDTAFRGKETLPGDRGSVEWAISWYGDADAFIHSYCNTVPTPLGGTHESGLRTAVHRGLRNYGQLVGNKKASLITADDAMNSAGAVLSLFIREPEFQGQTKEKLATAEAAKLVENAIRDHFDHWLSGSPAMANKLLDWTIDQAEERIRKRQEKEVSRKTATRKLRLPGKLADCSSNSAEDTEIFLVEGDSAGGSAKQARNRKTQAILPLRGKILNVASAAAGKLQNNQEISDIVQALGTGMRDKYNDADLRYGKVIIMTDADVDGAHIASLLITFFYRQMPQLIDSGKLFLALPPLYRLSRGGKMAYARDEAHKDMLLESEFSGRGKVDIGRFKGLGEMMPAQLRETTMDPAKRNLLRVVLSDIADRGTADLVEQLMGKKPELRFRFIQDRAAFAQNLDI